MTAQQQKPITYPEVRQAYRDHFLQIGVQPDTRAPQAIVLQLMSSVGEIAAFAQGNHKTLTDFEKEEMHDAVGSLAICLSMLGDVFNVDPADAALCRIQRLKRKAAKFNHSNAHGVSETSISQLPAPVPQRASSSVLRPPAEDASFPPSVSHSTLSPSLGMEPTNSGGSGSSQRPRPTIDASEAMLSQPSEGNGHMDSLPLSPNTQRNFYPMLDVIERSVQPEELPSLGLTFCVPGPDGHLVELIPDGQNTLVTPERWGEFLRKVAPYRQAAMQSQQRSPIQPPAPTSTPQRTPPPPLDTGANGQSQQQQQWQGSGSPGGTTVVRTIPVHGPRSYDPGHEAALFSPTHFSKDLFSPHNSAMSFDVAYKVDQLSPTSREEIYASTYTPQSRPSNPEGYNPARAILPPALQGGHHAPQQQYSTPQRDNTGGQGERGSAQSASPPQQQYTPPQATGHQGHDHPQLGGTVSDEAAQEFYQRFNALENGQVPSSQASSLGLFFVMPYQGRWEELTQNGACTPVTPINVQVFIHLVKEKQKAGRLRRTASTRTLAVQNLESYDPRGVATQFSPTHFTHNLFAPHTTNTTFDVDYEQAREVLPPSLQNSKLKGFTDPAQYVERITNREDTFVSILDEIKNHPEAVRQYKVTYCVPMQDRIVDLIPDGRHRMVAASDVPSFLNFVYHQKPYLKS